MNIGSILAWFGLGGITTGAIVIFLFKNPETFQKWCSIFWKIVSYVWKKADYFYIKFELQSEINQYVNRISENTNKTFPKIEIKWATEGDNEILWEEGKAVIVMRDKKHATKNFVHASYFFTSEFLLKKAKFHISKNQKLALDLYATKKILEEQSASALEHFMDNYFTPTVYGEEKVHSFIGQFVKIDESGLFFPILIQELISLGNKVYLQKAEAEIIKEVGSMIDFLEKFSERELGDITVPMVFTGKYMRCGIKILATRVRREAGDVHGACNSIKKLLDYRLADIYIIGGTHDDNLWFTDQVIQRLFETCTNLAKIKDYIVDGRIIVRGQKVRVKTSIIHLHNPSAVKYIYTGEDLAENALSHE